MTQKELINMVNQNMSTTAYGPNEARVKATLEALGEVATEALKNGGEVPFPGLGKLVVVATKARPGINPKTKEAIQIPAGRKAKFKASTELAKALKG